MENKRKVLLLSAKTDGAPGGIATWTDIYLRSAESAGIESVLVNTAQIGKRKEQWGSRVSLPDEYKRTKNIFAALRRGLSEQTIDIAHVNSSCAPMGIIRDYLCVKRIKRKGIPVVVQFHCDIPFQLRNRLSLYFLKKITDLADRTLVLCDSSAKYLERLGKPSETIPNFVDAGLCRETPRQVSGPAETLLFVGHVEPEKGVHEIYRLARRFPQKRFLLAGEVRADIAPLPVPENVQLLGRKTREEIMALLDRADVFLFPTHSEGFSLALSEAMARGLPCIATDTGANRDMLEGKGGIVVAVEDVQAMERAIGELDDPMLRKQMSDWCVDKVKQHYITPMVMKQLAAYYQQVCGQ